LLQETPILWPDHARMLVGTSTDKGVAGATKKRTGDAFASGSKGPGEYALK
jgi:hypothetical protein